MRINKFGEKFAEALKAKELTQEQLANKIGTTQQTISRWINNQREPSIDDILLICHFLDEDPNEIIGYNETTAHTFEAWERHNRRCIECGKIINDLPNNWKLCSECNYKLFHNHKNK